ncbi:UNVERIFIED_CONTAM: N-acetylgalactosaminyltransferase 6, partial [Eudyptes robustus]
IINKSPKEVLHEIILVDDDSDRAYLMAPLDDYLKSRGLDKLVKVIRPGKRHGLIRARQIGAEHATGEILIFLDSHSEAMPNWIPPLVEPIVMDYKTVVCPFIDVIDCNTFDIRPQDQGMRGSFAWNFDYKRLPLRPKDQKLPTDPFESPVMAGGYFAISAKWFWELGGYDEKLDIWGGEQYELSFKVWQCHGRMIDAPCSRVGHIYRCKRHGEATPFGFGDYLSRNYRRVADVWMDEYKVHLFKRRPGIESAKPGDLSKMLAIREKLQCKSFDWFMKNVADDQDFYYPAVEPEPSANGTVKNIGNGKCLDALYHSDGERVVINQCGPGEQNFKLTNYLDLRTSEKCLDIPKNSKKAPVVLYHCHMGKGNQMFRYVPATKQILHPTTGLCLDSDSSTDEVFGAVCDSDSKTQKWQFDNVNLKLLKERYANEKDL